MTMFGDFTDDDAVDTAPADPEAVARELLEALHARDPHGFRDWAGHTSAEKLVWVGALAVVLHRLHDERSV